VAILRGVPARSRWSLQARFFEGVSLLRGEDNEGALNAFQRVAQSVGQAEALGVPAEDAARLRDLAWLSIARVHYSAAGGGDEGEERLASSEALENALTAYKKVTAEGGYQDEALLEQAWALLRLGQFERALESLDGLSPLFAEATPEASYLRALIYFSRCDIDRAEKMIAIFRQEYGAREGAALRLERASEAELLEGQPSAGVSPHMPAVVRGALAQRDVKRRFELLAIIKAEKEILAALPSDPKAASLRAFLFQAEKRVEDAASERITAIVRARCERFLAESREEIGKADRITIEIQAIRGANTKCSPRRAARGG
jgi:tetratricopeptide (TPR) repeat protein